MFRAFLLFSQLVSRSGHCAKDNFADLPSRSGIIGAELRTTNTTVITGNDAVKFSSINVIVVRVIRMDVAEIGRATIAKSPLFSKYN